MTIRASLGGLIIGDGLPVAVMGAINVSPESFYSGSVAVGRDRLLKAAEAMAGCGAALLDVGAMSTAPYRATAISAAEEAERLGAAVEILVGALDVPVSADTSGEEPARAALGAGARVINDVRGLTGDARLAGLIAGAGAGLIVMASERGAGRATARGSGGGGEGGGAGGDRPGAASSDDGSVGGREAQGAGPHEAPSAVVADLLVESLTLAARAGIGAGRIVIDPGIGFFRRRGLSPHEWDCRVLGDLGALAALGRPVCVGVSRKSFIGALAGVGDPADRLPGSLAAASVAVLGGAHLIRCHDVAETVQAVRVAEAIRATCPPRS